MAEMTKTLSQFLQYMTCITFYIYIYIYSLCLYFFLSFKKIIYETFEKEKQIFVKKKLLFNNLDVLKMG